MAHLTFVELTERVNLLEFLLNNGYTLDRSKSTLKNPVLSGPNDEKLVLKNASDNKEARYFNATEGTSTLDRGNIVQFVKQRIGTEFKADTSLSLYANVNMVLHDYLHLKPEQKRHLMEGNKPTGEKPKEQFLLDLYDLKPFVASGDTYLEQERKIPKEILESPQFRDRIFVSQYKGRDFITFPFYDYTTKEISGLNFRASDVNTNAINSNKLTGMWVSNPPEKIERIVLTESPIDALSHAVCNKPFKDKTLYVANFGNPTLGQYQGLTYMLSMMEHRFDRAPELMMAYDKDVRGNIFALQGYNALSNGNYFTSVIEDKKKGVVTLTVSPFIKDAEGITATQLSQRDMYMPMLALLKNGQPAFMQEKSQASLPAPEDSRQHLSNLHGRIAKLAESDPEIKVAYTGKALDGVHITVPATTFNLEQLHEEFLAAMKPCMLIDARLDRPISKDYNQDVKNAHATKLSKTLKLLEKGDVTR
ncbi:MAG TPA: hypothetical protein VEY06_00680, partial [Flavisolibacter sp.]|nr:hypothetical protein [Flavisolibacter sp.]